MGDIADDSVKIADEIISGNCCAECGVWWKRGHLHVTLCVACWDAYIDAGDMPPTGYRRAKYGEL